MLFTIHIFIRTAVLRKLFDTTFSYKHCNFSRVCLLVKMASKSGTRSTVKRSVGETVCEKICPSVSHSISRLINSSLVSLSDRNERYCAIIPWYRPRFLHFPIIYSADWGPALQTQAIILTLSLFPYCKA